MATDHEPVIELMAKAQVELLRRCRPDDTLYAVTVISWQTGPKGERIVWSAEFPQTITGAQCSKLLREGANVLTQEAVEIEQQTDEQPEQLDLSLSVIIAAIVSDPPRVTQAMPRWEAVRENLDISGLVAVALCEHFHEDPHEQLTPNCRSL